MLAPKVTTEGTKDFWEWKFILPGKKGTAWEGSFLKFDISFPDDYPWASPRVELVDRVNVWHPNVWNGQIELNMLSNVGNGWSPNTTVLNLVGRIEEVMNNPDTSLGVVLNREAANQFDSDPKAYWARVKQSAGRLTFD